MKITYDMDVRRKMLTGVDILADAVKGTLGPKGRNVAMHQKANVRGADYSDDTQSNAHVLITNDGATVTRSMVLKDPVENQGVQLLKEAATKTNETAGDGTTTAIVLAQALLQAVFRFVEGGANPLAVRRGMKKAACVVEQELKRAARHIDTEEDISSVAAISCQDEELGKMVGQALSLVGMEGVITVEESRRTETTMELQEGIVFDRGFISPLMSTDEIQQTAELYDPYILLCDSKFNNYQELLPVMIMAAEDERSCLIISEGVEGDALGLVLRNRLEGDMQVVCVNAPEYGEGRRWRMEDLALQTGGVYVTKEFYPDIKKITREMLGTAGYVKVTRNQTVITEPHGDAKAVKERISQLRHLVAHTDYEFNRNRYKERLAKFVSGVAHIYVGGHTEPEIWERKMRVEDAVNTARAACEEGIVPGGGIALLNIVPQVKKYADTLEEDERLGALAVYQALKAPAQQIFENGGINSKAMVETLLTQYPGVGYDMDAGKYVDMIEAGIVDPVKVTRLAFEHAVSVAGTVVTVEAGITGKKKTEE